MWWVYVCASGMHKKRIGLQRRSSSANAERAHSVIHSWNGVFALRRRIGINSRRRNDLLIAISPDPRCKLWIKMKMINARSQRHLSVCVQCGHRPWPCSLLSVALCIKAKHLGPCWAIWCNDNSNRWMMKMRLIRSFARSDGPRIVVSVTAITTNHIRKYTTPRPSAPSTRKFKRILGDSPQLQLVVQIMVCTNIRCRLVPTAYWKRANI